MKELTRTITHSSRLNIVPEVTYNLLSLPRSFEQRRPDRDEAVEFLSQLPSLLPSENPYFQPDEVPSSPDYLASGFFFSTYRFRTSKGNWVAKIGLPHSPLYGYPAGGAKEHTALYNEQQAILQACFADVLPDLLPAPQRALFVEGSQRGSTVILQPFIDGLQPVQSARALPTEERQRIYEEIDQFAEISKDMEKGFGLLPDLLNGPNNLHIAPRHYGYRLVLLDNGLPDKNAKAHLIHRANSMAFSARIALLKTQLR